MKNIPEVLIVTSHFWPNVGGVETHLNDLVAALTKRNWNVTVATYTPLARNINVKKFEKKESLTVYRMPWIGNNIVHRLTPYPALEFLYLFPGLFFISLFAILKNPNIKVIHAQGLVPAAVALLLGVLTHRKKLASTHNLYFFPRNGIYKRISRFVFSGMDFVLCLSKQSVEELIRLGVKSDKVILYRYWLDFQVFKHQSKTAVRKRLKVSNSFTAFFFSRLIETKGVKIVLELVKDKKLADINFIIGNIGPFEDEVIKTEKKYQNLKYVGFLKPNEVRSYITASDVVLVPSLVDEGYGRVAMEAIACGTPVLAADRGGLNEVIDLSVGVLAEPSKIDFANVLLDFYNKPQKLIKMRNNTDKYAKKYFSENNVETIIEYYNK